MDIFEKIKIVVFDIDGCLTDGVYQISQSGEVTKSFYTRDFYAIEQLMRNNIKVMILSQSHDLVIHEQIKRILDHSDFWNQCFINNILVVKTEVDDKVREILTFGQKYSLQWRNIAYMGDAENDFECLKLAGFSGCPTDAIPEIRDIAMYPSDYKGGHGAVYDFCKYILKKKGK